MDQPPLAIADGQRLITMLDLEKGDCSALVASSRAKRTGISDR